MYSCWPYIYLEPSTVSVWSRLVTVRAEGAAPGPRGRPHRPRRSKAHRYNRRKPKVLTCHNPSRGNAAREDQREQKDVVNIGGCERRRTGCKGRQDRANYPARHSSQALPCNPSIPSFAMMGTMMNAATGSAHHKPKNALSSSPTSKIADR